MPDVLSKFGNDFIVVLGQDSNAKVGIREKHKSGEIVNECTGARGLDKRNNKGTQLIQLIRNED